MGVTWSDAAAAWVKSALVMCLGVVVITTATFYIRLRMIAPVAPNAIQSDVQGFHPGLSLFGLLFEGALFTIAVLVTLPLQATALRMRCNEATGPVFAAVAGLSAVAAIVSFAVGYALSPLLPLVGSESLFVVGYIGFYVFHILALVLARYFVRRGQRRHRDADAF